MADTSLAVTDTGGQGPAVLYLNGQFATQRHWRRVISQLGDGWRHLTWDPPARGGSRPSADVSFASWLRSVDAILEARQVERALLVGWSYGCVAAVHWARLNPERVPGVVLVDGAFPFDWLDAAMEQRIRTLFRRINWFAPVLRPLGLLPRLTADQQAESNIELGRLSRVDALAPQLNALTVPVRYVLASGTSFGSRGDEQERVRTAVDEVTRRNPRIAVSARVRSNHGAVLRRDFRAVASAIQEAAVAGGVTCTRV